METEPLKSESEDKISIKKEEKSTEKNSQSEQEKVKKYQRNLRRAVNKAKRIPVEEEQEDELYQTLAKTRKRNVKNENGENEEEKKNFNLAELIQKRKQQRKQNKRDSEGGMIFTSTTEFVKGLDDSSSIPTVKKEISEKEEILEPKIKEEKMEDGEEEQKLEEKHIQAFEEPSLVSEGLAATLDFLKTQGETESRSFMVSYRSTDSKSIKKEVLQVDDKYDLRKYDEFGRVMTPKEVFRHLSHRFHGKGAGKAKNEKRLKAYKRDLLTNIASTTEAQEKVMENMLEYQEKTKKPYIPLTLGSNSIQDINKQASEIAEKKLKEREARNKKQKTK